MIAAIERAKQCVWGVGPTPEAALQDAREQIAAKAKYRKITTKTADLEIATLRDDADLNLDGETMWQYGRGGWEDPERLPTGRLNQLLNYHALAGNAVHVGNFAMMLWHRDESTYRD